MAEEKTASFGYWVRRQRQALDLTQAMLARQVGCATVTISKIERDERRPSRQMAELLAEQLAIADEQRQHFLAAARRERSAFHMPIVRQSLETPLQIAHRAPRATLPALTAPAIQRSVEQTALLDLLNSPEARLVSVVGTGGVGKTHLAIQVAGQAAPSFKDGVCFVALESVRQAGLVTATLASALGVMASGGQTLLAAVLSILEDKRQLLVLDNFEQVLAAADVVASLLDACPHLKILITSREPLRLRQEHIYPLSPLRLPDRDGSTPDELSQSQAVQLFALRARAVVPDFKLNAATIPIVAAICIFLDGVPLAIELAAARLALFSLSSLLEALTGGAYSPLQLLRSDMRDVIHRQRSLRDTVAWSYDLLNKEEQMLFSRLAVFAGGCTLEEAQAVGMYDHAADEPVASIEMLALLTSLIRKNLVVTRPQADGSTRYALLEMIREFGVERLAERGEEAPVRAAHAAWYVELAKSAEPEIVGPDQVRWLDRLDAEAENLHAAIGWAIASGEVETALTFGATLYQFWRRRNRLAEGRYWLAQMLALPTDTVSSSLRSYVWLTIGMAAMIQGDYAEADRAYQNSVELARACDNRLTLARSYTYLGWIRNTQREYAEALRLIDEAIQLCQEMKYDWGLGMAFINQSHTYRNRGQASEGLKSARKSLECFQKCVDHWGIAFAAGVASNALNMLGRLEEARVYAEDSLSHSRAIQDRMAIAVALSSLAWLAVQQQRFDEAQYLFRESLQTRRSFNDKHGMASNIGMLADIELRCRRPGRAVSLARVAQREFQRMGVAAAVLGVNLDELLDTARNHLEPEAYAAAYAQAEVRTLADIAEELLGIE